MTIKIKPVRRHEIKAYQHQYYQSIKTPFDDYWANGIIANGTYYEIYHHEPIGYLVTNKDNVLLQFYIYKELKTEAFLFKKCMTLLNITSALVSTYEPNYLGRCLDLGLSYDVVALFYEHTNTTPIMKPFEDIEEIRADLKHLKDAVNYAVSEGAPSEWLFVYYNSLIEINGLYLYKHNNKIIGTGELRTSSLSDKVSNIGMTVSVHQRKKNVGSYILYRMTTLSYEYNLKPICGTDTDNFASQRTIEKCGYYPYHRALHFEF